MESLLGAALDADPGLLDYALAKGVTPATPTSLLALLKTIAATWRQATATEQATELLELGKALYDRLGTFADLVSKVGSALETTVKRYNGMVGSLESRLLVTCRGFDGFDAAKLEATTITPEKAQVRHLSAPEFAGMSIPDLQGVPSAASVLDRTDRNGISRPDGAADPVPLPPRSTPGAIPWAGQTPGSRRQR
jgi:DNA recombination protein RmuC